MEQVSKYFQAEKGESLLFMCVGVAAIMVSGYFLLKLKQPFTSGMAYSFIAIALIQLVVGSTVYFRSDKDTARVTQGLANDISATASFEVTRMETVMKNFVLYKWIEIALMLLGTVMFFYFQPESVLKGVGLGLLIQAGFMLLLDFFAEKRGQVYLDYLMTL